MKALVAYYSQSGQTKRMAEMIAEKMNADLSGYDTVLIGTGVWGYTMANPVTTFVRSMDFTGKRVSAFWTFYDHDEKWIVI